MTKNYRLLASKPSSFVFLAGHFVVDCAVIGPGGGMVDALA